MMNLVNSYVRNRISQLDDELASEYGLRWEAGYIRVDRDIKSVATQTPFNLEFYGNFDKVPKEQVAKVGSWTIYFGGNDPESIVNQTIDSGSVILEES